MMNKHLAAAIALTGLVLLAAQPGATGAASVQQDRDAPPTARERMNDMQGMGGMMRMMQQCREHCSAVSQAMDEMTKTLADAEQSNDPERMRAALKQAQDRLEGMKERMSTCMAMMDQMKEGMQEGMRGGMCPMCSRMMASSVGTERSELSSLPEPAAEAIGDLLTNYFRAGEALANDSTRGLAQSSQEVVQATDRAITVAIPEESDFWQRHSKETTAIRSSARSLAQTTDLETARQRYADLSGAVRTLIAATGVPPGFKTEVTLLDCPMFPKGEGGAIWLQPAGEVRNPYMGQRMLKCFGERNRIPVTGQPPENEQEQRQGATGGRP